MRNLGSSLAHISTISVGGYSKLDKSLCLTENDFNIGQEFNNHVYMITKYLAEYNVLTAVNDRKINGCIFRLGNIMPRYTDGVFQYNRNDNAFINRLSTIIELHSLTKNIANLEIDLSPVDLCAKSIVKILQLHYNQTIYHILNNNRISVKDLLQTLSIEYKIVSKKDFVDILVSQKSTSSVQLLDILNKNGYIETPVNSDLTSRLLESEQFVWNKIDRNYLNKLL